MIKRFNSNNLDQVRAEVEAALKVIGEKHSIHFTMGKQSYSNDDFTAPLKCVVVEEGLDPELARFKADLIKHGHNYGLSGEDFMKEATFYKDKVQILGVKSRAQKMPIIAMKDGKRYKYPQSVLKQYIAERDGKTEGEKVH